MKSMSQMVPQQTSRGYSPPTVRQFSVFLDNKVGKLLALIRLFDEAEAVHLCAFSVVDASDYAVVRIVPNNADAARVLLREHSVVFSELDLLIVELDSEHSLSTMCLYLLGAELNIRFAYPLLLRPNSTPAVALSVDDQHLAGQVLRKKSFRLLGEVDLP
ncbi:MAG: acetolactate synthase [Phycisphaerales bacterium]|nr:MAG: acetolactate synthase [Phycisphaerales bacterium]